MGADITCFLSPDYPTPGCSFHRVQPPRLRRETMPRAPPRPLDLPFDQLQLELGDCFRGVQLLRARRCAVHDGVAAIEAERVLEIVEPFAGRLIAGVRDPACCLQQRGRTKEAIAVPPIAGAGGRTAGAQDALIKAVEL